MAFNANEFRSRLTAPPASPAYFELEVVGLPPRLDLSNNVQEQLTFRCQSTSLPGRTVGTSEIRTNGIPRRQIPYGFMDEHTLTASILVLDGFFEKRFFDNWILQATDQALFDRTSGRFQPLYYDDIVGEVNIKHYDHQGLNDYTVKLEEAYPTQTTDIELDWGSVDSTTVLQVQFTYYDWKIS